MEFDRDTTKVYRAGDNVVVDRTITDIPLGTGLSKAWIAVKERLADADADALVFIEVTTSATGEGEILDIGDGLGAYPVGTGAVRFILDPETTRAIGSRSRKYAVKVLLDSDEPYTPEVGKIKLGEAAIAAEV